MKRYGMCVCSLAGLISLTLPSMAQDNPWNGSWKMDRSTLKYDGPSVSIATDADGYTITRGGKASPKVVCDGKPNPPDNGTVTTCTKTPTGYALESTRDDKQSSKVKVEVSSDGKTRTRTAEIFPAEGDPFTMTFVSKWVSGGQGAPVVWKETSFDESQDTALHGDLRTVERQQRMVNDGAKLVFTFRGEAVDMGCKRAGLRDGLCRRRRPGRGTRVDVFAENRTVFKADLER
jgi:hypothetical protein